ncbi:hypothetical protein DSECCO2_376700 [anaerobic digester metagenome]
MVERSKIISSGKIGVITTCNQNLTTGIGSGMEDKVAQMAAGLIVGSAGKIPSISVCKNSRIIQIHINRLSYTVSVAEGAGIAADS